MSDSLSSGDSSAKSLLWMTMALFAGFGVLLGGGLFMATHLVHSLGLAAATGKNTLRTPEGGFRMERTGEVGPGLPVYPHSSLELPANDDTAKVLQDARNGVSSVTYLSTDDRSVVEDWYVLHLGAEYTRHSGSEQPFAEPFQDVHVADGASAFLAVRNDNIRVVELTADATGTTIQLLRMHAAPPPKDAQGTAN
ncbi:MAG: hypothetical protein ABSG69_01715 [Candidatus Acidiferrum sp.]|jgi:hypothetical protein